MSRRDYSKDAQTALKLIDKSGTDCSLRKIEGSLIDPNKPWLGETDVEVGYPAIGVLLPLTNQEQSLFANLTAVKDTRKILLEAVSLTATPEVSDSVLFEGSYWKVENVKQLKPANTVIMYTLVVSR